MPDAAFDDSRLVSVYDAVEGDRGDLDHYLAVADEVGARTVLDLGCGTGVLARRFAERGLTVTAADPAAASLALARTRPNADRVRWILGDARAFPPLEVDLATMTGNADAVGRP